MANASAKRVASQNEAAIRNLHIGMFVANNIYLLLRLFVNRPSFPRTQLALYVLTLAPSLALYRWLIVTGTPRREADGTLGFAGEDLSQPGLIEYAWDVIYLTWACHVGSALLGSWMWWCYLLIPGYALFKTWNMISPMLRGAGGGASADDSAAADGTTTSESKRQAKLRKRGERGDSRITRGAKR